MFEKIAGMTSGEAVGKRIRDRRQSQRISQAELAKLVGLSSAAIWNWETKGRLPRPQILEKVAAALKVSKGYLAEGRESPDAAVPVEAPINDVRLAQTKVQAESRPDAATTVAEELEKTRTKIANLTGFDPAQIKLTLTVQY